MRSHTHTRYQASTCWRASWRSQCVISIIRQARLRVCVRARADVCGSLACVCVCRGKSTMLSFSHIVHRTRGSDGLVCWPAFIDSLMNAPRRFRACSPRSARERVRERGRPKERAPDAGLRVPLLIYRHLIGPNFYQPVRGVMSWPGESVGPLEWRVCVQATSRATVRGRGDLSIRNIFFDICVRAEGRSVRLLRNDKRHQIRGARAYKHI